MIFFLVNLILLSVSSAQIYSLNFINATNLHFNEDEFKWQFIIEYSSNSVLELGKEYSVSILSDDKPSLANCTPKSNSIMNCSCKEENSLNLIRLNNETNGADIHWENLNKIFQIPINCNLIYIDSYDLDYTTSPYLYYFSFEIEYDGRYLPQNSLVYIDINHEDNLIVCPCYSSYKALYCNFSIRRQYISFVKIVPKNKGTVEWINIDNNSTIKYAPLKGVVNAIFGADKLELINNKWRFRFYFRLEKGGRFLAIRMNVKIVKPNGNQKYHLARCLSYETENYNCVVEGENQDILDLLYIANTTYYRSGIIFTYSYNQQIKRLSSLKFVKTYAYFNNSCVKLMIDGEGNFPNKATTYVDLYFNERNVISSSSLGADCVNENNILTCKYDWYSDYVCKLAGLKLRGSIIWTNLKDKVIDIPKNHTLSFKNAHNLFFVDKWYFLISLEYNYNLLYNLMSYSVVLVDIIHNSEETTATCLYIKNDDLFCSSDYETQSETDVLQLRKYQLFGSINWAKIIDNNDISKANTLINELSLTFKDAYDMHYSSQSKWTFKIYAETSGSITKGLAKVDIYIIKSNGNYLDSTATCLIHSKDNKLITMICKANYDNQEKEDLIKMNPTKSALSTITWITGLTKYSPITLQTSLYLIKYDWWKDKSNVLFNVTVKEGSILPVGSKVVLDKNVKYDDGRDALYTMNCTAINNTLLFCNSTEYISIDYYKSPKSSVRWLNDQYKDEEIFAFKKNITLDLVSVDRLYYQESEKRWRFNLTVSTSYIVTAKLIVDVLYGSDVKTATCLFRQNILRCYLNGEEQDRNVLIRLTSMSSKQANIIWKNMKEGTIIPLWTELTFLKAENLKYESDKLTFDIIVQDENIPDNSLIIIDIKIIYYIVYMDYERLTTANCTYENKIFKCVLPIKRNLYYNYTIQILTKKNMDSISTIPKWNNVNKDTISIYLDINVDYSYSNRINKNNNGNYVFNLTTEQYIPKYSLCSLDILIGNKHEVIDCISYYYEFICEIEKDKYTNEEIYLSKTKSDLSSITWNNLYEDQILSTIQLEFVYAYYQRIEKNENAYDSVNILIKEDTFKNNNNIYTLGILVSGKEDFTFCKHINIGIINCEIEYYSQEEREKLYLVGGGNKGIIDWINPGNYIFDKTELYVITYKNLFVCFYDDINNCYNYTLEIENEDGQSKVEKFVMDLLINDNYFYGFCKKDAESDTIFNCNTQKLQKEENHIIIIKNGKPKYGNAELKNFPNDNYLIYPNNSTFVQASKIYDLLFYSNKWEFKIKPFNNVQLDQSKNLGILIDNDCDEANCKKDSDIIKCVVNSESQQGNQLITLRKNYIINNNIYLSNFNHYGIPFVTELEFISSSVLTYDNGWSFTLKVKYDKDSISIPTGSLFSIDIKYDNIYDDLAYCSEEGRNGIEINLLCIPQIDIKNDSLISLSNSEKTTYASVTWNPPLLEENTYLYLKKAIDVTQVYMSESEDENNFYMIVSNSDMPIGARVKIDLNYNDEYILGICILIEKNKFECFPQISPQNPNDIMSIALVKIYGTVTFINSEEKLKFLDFFDFVKTSNLKYSESKWNFDIELYKCRVKNGKQFELNVLVDDEEGVADCIYKNNILHCEVDYDNQDQFNIIKIINENNEYETNVFWNNLPDIVTLYYSDEYIFKNINGGFHQGKWKFNIYYDQIDKTKKFYNNQVILDILVNNTESTAICLTTYSSFLKCVANYENQNINDKIIIDINQKKNFGSISFKEMQVEPKKSINYAKFTMKYERNFGYSNQNDKLEIIIEGSLDKSIEYDLGEGTITMIKLAKYNTGNEVTNYDVICLTNNIKKAKGNYVYMICETELDFDGRKVEIINDEGNSNYIKFSPNKNIEIFYQY